MTSSPPRFARREGNDARQPCTGIMSVTDDSIAAQAEPLSVDQEFCPAQAERMENGTMSDMLHPKSTQQVTSLSSMSSSTTAPQHEPLKECQVETIESVTPEPPSSKQRPNNANVVSSDKQDENDESFESEDEKDQEDAKHHTFLPQFQTPSTAMWTATHAANAPSEDQSSSLVNVLLRPQDGHDSSLIRLSLWSVIDGHGGGIVATYAAQVLLPHMTASIAHSLDCNIVHQGECRVNNELRADAIDFQGLLHSSGNSRYNANSIHYSTPREEEIQTTSKSVTTKKEENDKKESVKSSNGAAAKHLNGPVGTHCINEVARVTQAVTDSFCAVDEGWINSIDVMTTRQTSCQKNGAWNAGACALVVFTIQRLEWTRTKDQPCTVQQQEGTSKEETSQKCTSMDCEPELMETEDESDNKSKPEIVHTDSHQSETQSELISTTTPGGCGCHVYSPRPAMLYTAHVGDCRAILLGSASPDGSGGNMNDRTVTTDEDSHDSEETELLSSSDSSSSSDEDDDLPGNHQSAGRDKTPPHLRYMTRPSRSIMRSTRLSRRNRPFLGYDYSDESDDEHEPARKVSKRNASPGNSSLSSEHNSEPQRSILLLPASAHCLDLTTDHTPYHEGEASAVLRRCNNAPKAIHPGVSGGGLRRVAGSLAVTRALGDAYLKTPLLSFGSYKNHAPYITSLPQINCRLLGNSSSVLVLATDGVWEQNSGEHVLGWMRTYADECNAAQAERNGTLGEGSNGDVGASPEQKKKRKLRPRRGNVGRSKSAASNVSEAIVMRVLKKAGRSSSRNLSMREVLNLPKGQARRTHDDVTVSSIDLSGFVASA